MSWRDQAHIATDYSLMVNLVLFLSYVLTKMCIKSFFTSEKNSPD